MVIGGQWLSHNWLLEIVTFVKASWRRRAPITSSTPRRSMSVCGTACGAWNLTVRVRWRTCLQTRADACAHINTHTQAQIDKHALKLVIGLMKPKDKNSKISPPVFVRVCECASGFLCCSSNALAHSRPPKTRQFPVRPAECDSSRCLMGKA